MPISIVLSVSVLYLLALFYIAANQKKDLWVRFNQNGISYGLSIAVFCTAWTFYGSIGFASTKGLGFATIYLGPTITAPLWIFFIVKIIKISKHQHITSLSDFISSRYGKSKTLGIVISIFTVVVIVPYISIQLKAVGFSFDLLTSRNNAVQQTLDDYLFYKDSTFYVAIVLTVFSIFFGTRNIDPNERHPGIVNAIAIESIIKLVCFIIAGVFITFIIGLGNEAFSSPQNLMDSYSNLMVLNSDSQTPLTWVSYLLLSSIAVVLLPRQFHIIVVENTNVNHVKKAIWIFPLYVFLISIFVLPIAFTGLQLLPQHIEADTYILSIPLFFDYNVLSLLVYIGGLSAATSMIIVSMLALSIMMSNNILMPLIFSFGKYNTKFYNLGLRQLYVRRLTIAAVMILSYGFYRLISIDYSLVSIGLISFVGIAQLAPSLFLGLYWKLANKKGVLAGLAVGIIIWLYTLTFPSFLEINLSQCTICETGPFGISFLKPRQLFGVHITDPITHGAVWSLILNTLVLAFVSAITHAESEEIVQADLFINTDKYINNAPKRYSPIQRTAVVGDLKKMIREIFGKSYAKDFFEKYISKYQFHLNDTQFAPETLIQEIENLLAGSFGSSSGQLLMNNVVSKEPMKMEDIVKILDQTYQTLIYSQQVQEQSVQLKSATNELKIANAKLLELDQLKNEFISTVTHELRTPITSIRSLTESLLKYPVKAEQRTEFLNIIHNETKRISKLINQVLDIGRIEENEILELSEFDPNQLIQNVLKGFREISGSRNLVFYPFPSETMLHTDKDKLKQVLYNLLSNAIKFTEPDGKIEIISHVNDTTYAISVEDNGTGIPKEDYTNIFDRFYQVSHLDSNKPQGSGLGLYISQKLMIQMNGSISLESHLGRGTIFTISLPK